MLTREEEGKVFFLVGALARGMGDYGMTPGVNGFLTRVVCSNVNSGVFDVSIPVVSEREKGALRCLERICLYVVTESFCESYLKAPGTGEGDSSLLHGEQAIRSLFESYSRIVEAVNKEITP